jgi:hypothetical protein
MGELYLGENGQGGRREERIRRLKHEKIGGKYKLKKKNIYGYVCRNELVYISKVGLLPSYQK